jgi:hypothetical protein
MCARITFGLCLLTLAFFAGRAHAVGCTRTVTADVVALDQVFFYNRLGAFNPAGMMYALRRDVVNKNTLIPLTQGGAATPGEVMLREDKRPRPLVLRMNVGDCLVIHFQNLLAPAPVDGEQPATRTASIHVTGMQLVTGIGDDGSNVGQNTSSLVAPGATRTYTVYAEREGTRLMYSGAAQTGGEGDGGSLSAGLFGAVNVEPANAEWYRSQLTEEEMRLATTGQTGDGHPIFNYDATYPNAQPWIAEGKAGLPILKMLNVAGEIVHSDLNAIITGPARGNHVAGTYPANAVLAPSTAIPRDRHEPFREFTVIFHDEIMAIQAFDRVFEDSVLGHTLHSVRDGFAINYGTGGAGAEILANRLGVGPMRDCVECKYEEFFLSSWAVGDPATIVDVPASNGLYAATPAQLNDPAFKANNPTLFGAKAAKAFYPDDPANVHHSYIGDHVKIRNLHAGPKEHHIFHLHAHQWLFTPDSDLSAYLDSQAIGPGSNYTYDITYNGSGNRNQMVGDAIFHCHFYPHFAQGMWALWRNHDVFEPGTRLAVSGDTTHANPFGLRDGTPAANARALPDSEILAGTPIPGVVPLPHLAMPPMPGSVRILGSQVVVDNQAVNPGYPFFIPGRAGHRAPHPPLDTVFDGGLPRHVVRGGTATVPNPVLNRLDFSKASTQLDVEFIPETGAPVELTAMAFHGMRTHNSVKPDGSPGTFVTNGLASQPGAPFADPCINDAGNAVGNARVYKAAHIQLDMKLNKLGEHFPQARMTSLWQDVANFQNGSKPPEPFFFRANTGDCIVYHFTNLIPFEYKLDDFQVRTPTDITSQHIHLVKFDVTASDGAGNGWNYEDASFSPDEVHERIDAINAFNAVNHPGAPVLAALPHPELNVSGAQTTIQRWYADDVLNNSGQDRTLRTVYTHDHFAPSTHQQGGLYAGLVIEPTGSTWRDSESGVAFGTRDDGGPTSWRADILTANANDSFREFMLEFADFQPAYKAGGGGTWANPIPDPANVINPPAREQIGLPFLTAKPQQCPGGVAPPCPEAISADDPGVFSVNYRNEPVAHRILANVNCTLAAGDCAQAAGTAGDLAYAFRSDITRAISALNSQPGFYPPLTGGLLPGDPFTPLLRAYRNDNIQIRILVGAQEEGHVMTIHGLKWLHEPSYPTSGWRNAQMAGISEHFEFLSPVTPLESGQLAPVHVDYKYSMDAASEGDWNGAWGILRAYDKPQTNLQQLPNNPVPAGGALTKITNAGNFNGVCPVGAPLRAYTVFAISAKDSLPGGNLVYNPRTTSAGGHTGPLRDPTALLYVLSEDLNAQLVNGKWVYTLKPDAPIEPVVLRANAGDCIEVTLRNTLPTALSDAAGYDMDGYHMLPMNVEGFNANQVNPSSFVGLHTQLAAFDPSRYNGVNVGKNTYTVQTAGSNRSFRYRWYAGDLKLQADGTLVATPVEFGAVNLIPTDVIKHSHKGLVGALIVEPLGATWPAQPEIDPRTNRKTRTSATVTVGSKTFRDLVVVEQTDVQLRDAANSPICPVGGGNPCEGPEDSEDSGNKAINYRSEPFWFRMGYAPGLPFEQTRDFDFTDVLANAQVGGDPATPVFTAQPGQEVRFRVLQSGGHARNNVFALHGHAWQKHPYANGTVPSQSIGDNPVSEVFGAQAGHGPSNHFDMILSGGAGGEYGVQGDYLFRDQASIHFDAGVWGILRVTP